MEKLFFQLLFDVRYSVVIDADLQTLWYFLHTFFTMVYEKFYSVSKSASLATVITLRLCDYNSLLVNVFFYVKKSLRQKMSVLKKWPFLYISLTMDCVIFYLYFESQGKKGCWSLCESIRFGENSVFFGFLIIWISLWYRKGFFCNI